MDRVLESSLSPKQVLLGVQSKLDEAPSPIEGSLEGNRFSIKKKTYLPKFFKPQLICVVEPTPAGSRVDVLFSRNWLKRAVIVFFYAFVLLGWLQHLFSFELLTFAGEGHGIDTKGALTMLLFLTVVAIVNWLTESSQRSDLLRILAGILEPSETGSGDEHMDDQRQE